MLQKSFVCRPEIDSKYFDKLKPEPRPTRKARPDLTESKVSFWELYLRNDTNIYDIKSKCPTVNWHKCTKFHL